MPTPSTSTLLQFVQSPTWPLSVDAWNTLYSDIHSNCMAFAFGLPIDAPREVDFDEPGCISSNYQHQSIALSIIDVCATLNLSYRRIDNPEVARHDEYVIGAWGYFRYYIGGFYLFDFHFIRRDIDGKWYHKPGWELPPREIVDWQTELEEWLEEGEPVYFAIKKKSP